MNILVTGFDAFGDDTINPSTLILDELPDKIGAHLIDTLQIPTSAKEAEAKLNDVLSSDKYDAVVCIGQAGGRADITLERVAINLDEFRIRDNSGEQLSGCQVIANGPDAFLSRLPLKSMVSNMQDHSIPASISYTAGTFVCNHVYYYVHYLLSQHSKSGSAVFIHVPFLPKQVIAHPGQPSMSLDIMVEGIIGAIEAIDTQDTREMNLGTIC